MTSFLRLKQSASRKDYDRKGFFLTLKEHFQKSFVKLSKIAAAVTAIELYLSQNLGVIKFLAEAAVFVLIKTGGENNPLGNFQKLFVIAAVRTQDALTAV
jgi:hypothetical protein